MQYLVFGSPELQSWPTQLHWLRHLQTIYVHGLNMTSLPQDAFKGLWYVRSLHIEDSTVSSIHENALSELMNVANLFIENTGLHGIPAAICDLKSLRHLNVSGNHMRNSRHLVPSCPTPLLEVVSVYFDNNSLTSFPDIFSIFPNITRLYITNNPRLTTITSDKIPKGIHVNTKYIYLNGNGFTTIPSALEKLTQLTHMELNNNHITSISRVLRFQNLSSLSLRNNPINNISPSAFVNTSGLYRLDLANTGLTTIPHALSGLGENWRVDLQENPIRCKCALKWAKNLYKAAMSWVDTSRIYDGNCYGSNWRLLSYMRRNITQCH